MLRASFSRFEALRHHGKTVAESPGWALNAHGVYDSHIPECFSFLHFTERRASEAAATMQSNTGFTPERESKVERVDPKPLT